MPSTRAAELDVNESQAAMTEEIVAHISRLYEFARLQDGVNEDIVAVVKAMQEQSDSRYDRLDARILSVLKRLDKLEGKH